MLHQPTTSNVDAMTPEYNPNVFLTVEEFEKTMEDDYFTNGDTVEYVEKYVGTKLNDYYTQDQVDQYLDEKVTVRDDIDIVNEEPSLTLAVTGDAGEIKSQSCIYGQPGGVVKINTGGKNVVLISGGGLSVDGGLTIGSALADGFIQISGNAPAMFITDGSDPDTAHSASVRFQDAIITMKNNTAIIELAENDLSINKPITITPYIVKYNKNNEEEEEKEDPYALTVKSNEYVIGALSAEGDVNITGALTINGLINGVDVTKTTAEGHSHSIEDIKDLPDYALANHHHDSVYSKIYHNHDAVYSKLDHNHDDTYSKTDHTHENFSYPVTVEDNLSCEYLTTKGITLNGSLTMNGPGETTLYNVTMFGTLDVMPDVIVEDIIDGMGVAYFGKGFAMKYAADGNNVMLPCLDFIIPSHTHPRPYEWRIAPFANHGLYFLNYAGTIKAYISSSGSDEHEINRTITHNAPLAPVDEIIDNFKVGAPVFMSGCAYKLDENGEYSILTDSINCVPGVKSTGTYKEFLGICTAIHHDGDTVTVGDVMKNDVVINQDTIDFATHGDFYFTVDATIKYHVGDTVLYDGTILDDEEPLTNKIKRSIVGVVTALIDDVTLAVFKA